MSVKTASTYYEFDHADHTWLCFVSYDWSSADKGWFEIRKFVAHDENHNSPDKATSEVLQKMAEDRLGRECADWAFQFDD